jgi:hypothetical protein
MIHEIGSFAVNAFSVVIWAVAFAATLAICFSSINTARTGGNDPNLSQIPAVAVGVVLGGIIGAIIAFAELASSTFIINMFGWWVVAVVVCFCAVRLVRRLRR